MIIGIHKAAARRRWRRGGSLINAGRGAHIYTKTTAQRLFCALAGELFVLFMNTPSARRRCAYYFDSCVYNIFIIPP